MGKIFFTNECLGIEGVKGLDAAKFIEITPENSHELLGRKWLDGVRNAQGESRDLSQIPKDIISEARLLICKVNDEIGFTVITLDEIKEGKLVCCYGSELISFEAASPDDDTITPVNFESNLEKETVLSARKYTNVGPYINHAPSQKAVVNDYQFIDKKMGEQVAGANLVRHLVEPDGINKLPLIIFQSVRTISANSVLTYDYSAHYFFEQHKLPKLFLTNGSVIPDAAYRYNYYIVNINTATHSLYIPLNFRETRTALESQTINTSQGGQISVVIDEQTKEKIVKQMADHLKHYTPDTAFIGPLKGEKIQSSSAVSRLFSKPSAAQVEAMMQNAETERQEKLSFTNAEGEYDQRAHEAYKLARDSEKELQEAFDSFRL